MKVRKILFGLLVLSCFQVNQTQAQTWDQRSKIVANDREAGDHFSDYHGVHIHGDWAVVGSHRADHSGLTNPGAAYIYKRNASNCQWSFSQKIIAPSPANSDFFGISVAIHGNYIVVGAQGDDDDASNANTMTNSGAAYIFRFNGTTWNFAQKIVANDREPGGVFGTSVDIQGRRLIVGAWGEDHAPGAPIEINSGAAYIFDFDGSTWTESVRIQALDQEAQALFGTSVAISGNYAVVGAYREKKDELGLNPINLAGAAYIYERVAGVWDEVQKVVPTGPDRGIGDYFGLSVDIDGAFIIVGSDGDNHDENVLNPLIAAGSAFIYQRNYISGNWDFDQKIVANDRSEADHFGHAVSITKERAVVGAFLDFQDASGGSPVPWAGSAYIFDFDGTSWGIPSKIVADDRQNEDRYGTSVAIDGDHIIVGAYKEDHDAVGGVFKSEAGSAYIYELNTPADQPIVSSTDLTPCPGETITLAVDSGDLNDATQWQWYTGGCNGTVIGTGLSIDVNPLVATTYYVNGIGGCVDPGVCGTITINPGASTVWHQTTKNTAGGDITTDVITDANNNVYVTGTFKEKTTLNGGGNPDIIMTSSTGQLTSYVAKYNPCGDLLWEAHTTECLDNEGRSIVLDEAHNVVYITGYFTDELRFISSGSCGGPLITIGGIGSPKGYVAAFDMTTGCVSFLDPIIHNTLTKCEAITIDEDNLNIFVGGKASPTMYDPYTSFVYKFSPSGSGIGAVVSTINSSGSGEGNRLNDMDYDEANNKLYIIGDFNEKVTFYPGTGTMYTNSPAVEQDAYLLAYKDYPTSFDPIINRIGNTHFFMSGEGVSIDPVSGGAFFTGSYQEDVDEPFETGAITSLPGFSSSTAYMIGYHIDLNIGWSKYANSPAGRAYGKAVVVKNGRVYYTGNFIRSELNIQSIGTYPYVAVPSAMDLSHVYIASYSVGGASGWGNVTTDPTANSGIHQAESITADNNGQLYIVGEYRKNLNYLATSGAAPLASSGAGLNGFIIRANASTGDMIKTEVDKTKASNENQGIEGAVIPNPTTGLTKYIVQDYDSQKNYTIRIVDLTGRIILETVLTNRMFEFDLSSEQNGIYFIQLSDGINTTFNKVIKTN